MLWISAGLAVLSAILNVISLATGNAAKPEDDQLGLIDVAEVLMAIAHVLIFILTAIAFLGWIYRANTNARALGARGMQFTPGWSIGWYFIPILSFWKPYQAMKEIWQASKSPDSWSSQDPVAPLVSNWWTLWLAANFLGQSDCHSGPRPPRPARPPRLWTCFPI
jgi:hypothetical protein